MVLIMAFRFKCFSLAKNMLGRCYHPRVVFIKRLLESSPLYLSEGRFRAVLVTCHDNVLVSFKGCLRVCRKAMHP